MAAKTTGETSFSNKMLFWASFFTLIAAGIGFSMRNAIVKDWGGQFGFTQSELGSINGGGLFGFGMTIIVLSFVADWIGYGRLMLLAFVLYIASAVVTFAAGFAFTKYGKDGAYYCLFIGAWLFSLANGTCETVINPLTATLFPKNKTHWLNILHAGWPGGLILGAVLRLVLNKVPGLHWEYKLATYLAPVLLFGVMMLGRTFPKSEAKVQGVSIRSMMGEVGFFGMAVVVFFLGLLLSSVILPLIPKSWVEISQSTNWAISWGIAIAVWLVYAVISGFKLGHLVLTCLYLLHALVGYVELGTDSWIINIGDTVLKNEDYALYAFIWTNLLMFGLRFFAGPIVHKISPLGLLFFSAVLGTTGLLLFSQSFVDKFWIWMMVSTIFAMGKTFYWPTVLGVISERFPKGGALALGFSGGIGMLSAGLLGSPGIGYKQDYFSVQRVEKESASTYIRYEARNDQGQPDVKGFPLVSDLVPERVPKVAGLDNAKMKIVDDYAAARAAGKEGAADSVTADLDPKMRKWWDEQGRPNYQLDKPLLDDARLYGKRTALLYTAAVPATMAVGFLLLWLYFIFTGGYKQVHLDEEPAAPAEY
ncbi:MAG TPA: MFS transporter [Gemmataceae bacterium]|nr:MFS transporter [Gemmataceae bacterium]